MESPVHEAGQFRSLATSVMKHDVPVNAVGQGARRSVRKCSSTSQGVACVRCGNSEHTPDKCPFRDAERHHCNTRGHLRRVRRKRLAEEKETLGKQTTVSASRGLKSPQRLHAVEDLTDHATSSEGLFIGVNSLKATCATLSARPDNPLVVEPLVNGVILSMEVDTGAAVSVISRSLYDELFRGFSLNSVTTRLSTYSGEVLKVCGEFPVRVLYNGQESTQKLLVVENAGHPLFGRDWLRAIRLDWSTFQQVHKVHTESNLSSAADVRQQYPSLFSPGIGKLKGILGHLDLKSDTDPKFMKARPLPYALRSAVSDELDRLEAEGVLKKVEHSKWATPIVAVPKSNGRARLGGDFKCTVNPQLNIPQYPLPKVEDALASLGGGVSFTKLDLTQAYLHMEMDEESQEMMPLNTHRGLYRMTRLGFGIVSAAALWQRAMDTVLQDVGDTQCLLDDILESGKTDQAKEKNLTAALQQLDKYGLKLNVDKCEFFRKELSYLGHVVSRSGIKTMLNKVQAICDAPIPQNVSELRSFLGLVNYYQRFVPNMSSLVYPLNQLLGKGVPFQWSSAQDDAFRIVKTKIASADVLTHFHPDFPLLLATDAAPYGIGAVLSHRMEDGTERPIAFASRSWSTAVKNYSQIDKEALGIVRSVKKFFAYLYGHHFTLITDHKPLTSIFHPAKSLPELSAARLQRYAIFLSSLTNDVVYRKTSDHCNADALSRMPLQCNEQETEPDAVSDPINTLHVAQLSTLPMRAADIRRATASDPVLSRVYFFTQSGWPDRIDDDSLRPYFNRRLELTSHNGVLLRGLRVVIPPKFREAVLSELHTGHRGIVKIKQQPEVLSGGQALILLLRDLSARARDVLKRSPTRPRLNCTHGNGQVSLESGFISTLPGQ